MEPWSVLISRQISWPFAIDGNIRHGFRTKSVMPPNLIKHMRRLMLSYAHKLPNILLMLIAFCRRRFAFSNRMVERYFWRRTGTLSCGSLTTRYVWRLL